MKRLALAIAGDRNRRVFEALILLWALATGDLVLTALAMRSPDLFYESNPLARALMLSHGLAGLVCLKIILLGFAGVIFWQFRKHACTELAVWSLVFIHLLLLVQWSLYTAIAATAS